VQEHVSGRDVTSGAEAPEAALDDADEPPGPTPSGADVTAGEAAPETAGADEEPDPDSTAG
jgi:hypothetical protein